MVGLLVLALCTPAVRATSFTVVPVRVEVSPKHLYTTLQVTSNGDEKVTVRVRPIQWILQDGREFERDTEDLIFSPPIFTILPHQTQDIRIGLQQNTAPTAEQTYRLILEEVPAPAPAGFTGVRTSLRFRIPLFVRPAGPATTKLSWSLRRTPRGITLSVENNGSAPIQIKHLALRSSDPKESIVIQSGTVYILPAGRKEWLLDNAHFAEDSTISLQSVMDGSLISEKLTLLRH